MLLDFQTLAFNRAVYAALKPGSTCVILDHVAAPGSPANVTDTLHRIEPAVLRRQVDAAGFGLVGESRILANPADLRPGLAGIAVPTRVIYAIPAITLKRFDAAKHFIMLDQPDKFAAELAAFLQR